MALWQYTFHLLHRESVETLSPDYHFDKDDWGFDDEPYWRFNPVSKDFFNEMSKILPRNKSWSNEIDLYGDQESNCFEVSFQDGNVVSVSFRIDFTSNYEPILTEIIEFCICRGLIIIDETLKKVLLNFEIIKNIIENSSQKKMYQRLM